jgi:hypothetical protein
MKRYIFLIALILGLAFSPGWTLGQGYNRPGPSISISPEDYDAGDLSGAPDTVYKVFQVFNTGDTLLSIAKIKYT